MKKKFNKAKLQILNLYVKHKNFEDDVLVEKLSFFKEEDLKSVLEYLENASEDYYLDLTERLIEIYYNNQNLYEDGELVFPKGHYTTNEYFGFKLAEIEPSQPEQEFLEKQNLIYQLF